MQAQHFLTCPRVHAGTAAKRAAAYNKIKVVLGVAGSGTCHPGIASHIEHADRVIIDALSVSTWERNASWAVKFANYIREFCPDLVDGDSVAPAVARQDVIFGFLSKVDEDHPGTKTVVKSARRAINALRSFMGLPTLENDLRTSLLIRAGKMRLVRTVKQSAGIPIVMLVAITSSWGQSPIWWKRQVALMILVGVLALARGAGVTSCLSRGVSWVACLGHQLPPDPSFRPAVRCDRSGCAHPRCVKGFLILIPFRKNKQDAPTWIPIAEKNAISLMAQHLSFLHGLQPATTSMFLGRDSVSFVKGRPVYLPLTHPGSRMSTEEFRALIRLSLRECCGLSQEQAELYGTHSLKIGAIELLRSRGVGQELRQQLGGWMSSASALRYLQLTPSVQFDVLKSL